MADFLKRFLGSSRESPPQSRAPGDAPLDIPPPVRARSESDYPEPDGWDLRFLEVADLISGWSKDPSTKVGCVVVGSDREVRATGFNGFPRGADDDPVRYAHRDTKLRLICHAEENAVAHAAHIGVSLRGTTAYITWPPCPRCARSLIQAGVERVVHWEVDIPDRWVEDMAASEMLLNEVGITIVPVTRPSDG